VFALPKIALFPAVVARHPRMAVIALPALLAVDALKGKVVARLSAKVEELRRENKRLLSVRTKVEAHDSQHAALVAATRATDFTRRRWAALNEDVVGVERLLEAFSSIRNWIGWLYWQDVFNPGMECMIALLLEQQHITAADTWLYMRVVEDAVETFLVRSRREAELAQLVADTARLTSFVDHLDTQRARAIAMRAELRCTISGGGEGGEGGEGGKVAEAGGDEGAALHMAVAYRRGAAAVRVRDLSLRAPGVYAVVGPNGAGKSSLFGLLGACAAGGGGHVPTDMTVEEGARLSLPPGDVALVSQRHYCPLHCRPIAWLAHALPRPNDAPPDAPLRAPPDAPLRASGSEATAAEEGAEEAALAARAAALAAALRFGGAANLSEVLLQEHDDYCATLSGGQRAKLELISQVFLRPRCPALLLLDEAFAPLDPASKALVMRRLRSFCAASLVLVIYHGEDADTDGDAADEGVVGGGGAPPDEPVASAAAEACAVGDGFFDGVVGFSDDGNVTLLELCRHNAATDSGM